MNPLSGPRQQQQKQQQKQKKLRIKKRENNLDFNSRLIEAPEVRSLSFLTVFNSYRSSKSALPAVVEAALYSI
jgi:hypothetical protein